MARKAHRRGNGEGSICQRPNGTWFAMVTVGRKADGKADRRTVSGTPKLAVQEKLVKLRGQQIDGMLCGTQGLTVGQYLDRWLRDAAKPRVRATTFDNYGRGVRYVKAVIGAIQLGKLTPLQVQAMYGKMQADGFSPDKQRLAHAVLRRALRQGVKWGLVPRNVCDAVEQPRSTRKEIQPLSIQQAGKLLEAVNGDRLEALYVLAVSCGMRMGELFGLQWTDIDLAAGTLNVRRSLTELNGQLYLSEPKTATSKRRIELPQFAVAALWRHKAMMLAEGQAANERVFCDTRGGWLRRSHFHCQWYKPMLKRAGLPKIRFHDLRHTAATLLLSQNVHPKIVQERLGHSGIAITLDLYSHAVPSMQRDAADKLDVLFTAAAG